MNLIDDIDALEPDQVERIEKLTLRWIFQAILDFGMEAYDIFYQSPDEVKEVGEDVTREILDRMSGYNVQQRVFGTVDYKKARYIILPEQMVRQALFVDAKAEKDSNSATIQMSQTSLYVRQTRAGVSVNEKGMLPLVSLYGGKQYLTTTAFLHFCYHDAEQKHYLNEIRAFVVPNGKLQDRYNPNAEDGFWIAGRNAPTLGEDFRVRVSFHRLKQKANWRVQRITYDTSSRVCAGTWED